MKRAAWIYAGLTLVVVSFHLAMALGAPWGHLTMGGRWTGVLPLEGRVAAAVNVVLLAALAALVLSRAGILALPAPRWAIWAIVAYLTVGVVLHIITPSAAERALWLPQLLVMWACAVVVARGRAD